MCFKPSGPGRLYRNVVFEPSAGKGEGLRSASILVGVSLFLMYFISITIHQKVFVRSIIRNQEGRASDESD